MKTFPMFLKTSGRSIVICGGAEQAAQKTRLALKTDARIIVAAAALEPELAALAAAGRIAHHTGPISPAVFKDAALVFAATGCKGADAALAALARNSGAVVNVVDAPELCDAFTPSIVDRDPLVVAVGTEGAAPVLGRLVKTQIETMLEPRLGDLVALAGRLRGAVAARLPLETRRGFWRWVFAGAPREAHARGAEREAARLIKQAIEAGGAPDQQTAGFVSLVGAGPGARDLLTLRAVKRLQEADIIFYDRLVDPEALELARRDAERVYVGKAPGAHAWPQERINGVIVAAARQGKRVVRLKCGDPGVFSRGREEADALDAAEIDWEIVPGVTAACAASAALGGFLTERGRTDTLVLSSGMSRAGDAPPDWAGHLRPGATLALYMAVERSQQIVETLLSAGCPPDLPVEVAAKATCETQQILRCALSELPAQMKTAAIRNTAIILIRRPKSHTRGLSDQECATRASGLMLGRV